MPRGLIAVYAMARPRRPVVERQAVLAAAIGKGSQSQRAAQLADRVAVAALKYVDADPADRLANMLRDRDRTPVSILATDAEIDTASLIIAERVRRLESRGGQLLQERHWTAENRATVAAVAAQLTERYRRFLRTQAK